MALKMTNREVDGVSVMQLDRHIVLASRGRVRSARHAAGILPNAQ